MPALRDLCSCLLAGPFSGSIALEARSLENPMFSLQDPSSFEAMGIGMPSSAGIRVDRRTALTLDTWYRAVDFVSDLIMRCPLEVYRWVDRDTGDAARDREHAAYRLLFQAARTDTGEPGTEFLGAKYWKKTMQAHASNHGNAYSYIDRFRDGRPRQLVPLAPDRTYPIRVNGRKFYVTHVAQDYIGGSDGNPENTGQAVHDTMIVLRPEDVFHLKGLGYDCMMGYTTFDLGGETLGQALATRQYGSKYFANNAEPRVVIELPVGQNWTIQEKQEFVRQFDTMHSSVNNAHRTAMLTNGAKISPFPTSAEQAQLVANRQMSAREVANWHKLRPHILGDSSRTAYNSLELEEHSILSDCGEPWMALWTEECDAKLLTARQQETYSHFTAFDRNALIHTTITQKAAADSQMANNGLRTVDELRARDGLQNLPDGVGKVVRCPVNIAVLHAAGKPPAVAISGIPQKQGQMPAPAGTPKPADQKQSALSPSAALAPCGERADSAAAAPSAGQARPLNGPESLSPAFDCAPIAAVLRDAAERAHARLTKAMQAAAKHPERFGDWLRDDARRHAEPVAKIIGPALNLRMITGESAPTSHNAAGGIVDAWLAAHGNLEKFTVETILEKMR